MKKILSTTLALGLVAGFAATASALDVGAEIGPATGYDRSKDTPTAPGVDLFSVKGSYALAGAYQSDANGAGNGVDLTEQRTTDSARQDKGGDAFYFHSFKTNMSMHVGDKIRMHSELRFADRDVWGYTGGAGAYNGGTIVNDGDLGVDQGRQLDIRKIYMEYDSPIGKWRMGRVPVSAWYGTYLNSGTQGNRIMWWPNFIPKPFSVLLFTQKMTEADALPGTFDSDADSDGYYAGIEHKGNLGTTALAYWYNRVAMTAVGLSGETLDRSEVWLYGKYNVAMLTIEGELDFIMGDNNRMSDRDALAGMLDVTAKFGNLSVGGLYFYASGNDKNYAGGTQDNEAALAIKGGTGDDFNPYHILTGDYTGILNTDKDTTMYAETGATSIAQAGVHSFGVHAAFQVTPKLGVSGAIGTAWAVEEQAAGQDDSYGVEYDLNVSYKLLDNLVYSAHFGYLDTGDFFEYNDGTFAGTAVGNNISVNEITFVANQITMTF